MVVAEFGRSSWLSEVMSGGKGVLTPESAMLSRRIVLEERRHGRRQTAGSRPPGGSYGTTIERDAECRLRTTTDADQGKRKPGPQGAGWVTYTRYRIRNEKSPTLGTCNATGRIRQLMAGEVRFAELHPPVPSDAVRSGAT